MEMTRKRRPREIALGFFLLSHPIPVLFHIIAVTIFALLAAWPRFAWNIIVLVIAAHTAMQLSIAVLNDYCDRRLDAVSKRNKPIPRGLVYPHEALIMGILLIVLMVLLLLPLNPLALLISLLYLAFGQAYNLGLKSTPLSGIVFALAIPLIPVYAFIGVGRITPLLFWLVPVAALLGIALNLANSLPDIEQDAANGAHTLAVALGVRGSFLACPLLILLSITLIAVLSITRIILAQTWIMLPVLLTSSLATCIMILFFGPGKAKSTRKLYFYLVVLTCLVLAGGWLIGVLI
ncbi:MAG: UbiA family prenyltransferase [Chloroflexi bacterium]|nr:UbiA family prenyltransferase [Chloroflexota bacterium]